MNSDILLEMAAIFFSNKPLSKTGIIGEYVMVDFICQGLLELYAEWIITKLKILSDLVIQYRYLPLIKQMY